MISRRGHDGTTARTRIEGAGLDISQGADARLRLDAAGTGSGEETAEYLATLLPVGAGDAPSAVLLLPGHARQGASLLLDGLPPLGVTELPARAEISLGADTLFYDRAGRTATAGRAATEIFDGVEEAQCARCKRPLEQGDAIRRCSLCASPHHEGPTANPELPDLSCGSYDQTCARCREPWEATSSSLEESAEEVEHVD